MNTAIRWNTTWLSLGCLLMSLALYTAVGVADLRLPGLQYDEAADAVPAMELLTGQPISSLSTVTLFGRQLPVMMLHHIGPTTIWTSFIGMTFMGISVQALRISQLTVGAITLILIWVAGRRWFDDVTAAFASLMCATAPAFIWWNRAGANWTAPLLPIALGMLLLLESWWRTRKTTRLVGAAFLFGVGFTTKILFIWLLAPLVIMLLVVVGVRQSRAALRSLSITTLALVILALLAGLSPFILHNILSPFATFTFLSSNVLSTAIYGHNNLDFVNNLRQVVTEFVVMIGGDTLAFQAPSGPMFGSFVFTGSVIFEIAYCIKFRNNLRITAPHTVETVMTARGLRFRFFFITALLTIIPLSTISTSSIGATYLFILVPLAWLLIAVAVRDASISLKRLWKSRFAKWSGTILVLGLVVAQIGTNAAIIQFFETTGGRGLWSDSIYTLADELATRYGSRSIIAMDWGFTRNVTFLTRGSVHMREAYEFLPKPSARFDDVATALLQQPENVYVFHSPDATVFHGYEELFARAASRMHKQLQVVSTIRERLGMTESLVYESVDIPRSFVVSPTLATRNANFAGDLALLGGSAVYDPGKREVAINLLWQTGAAHQPDDTVLIHIVDQSSGAIVANGDQQPVYGSYPFSVWQKGEVVTDPHWVILPMGLHPGIYQVRVGVYDRQTGVRREITDPMNDAAGNSLMLHSFEIK